MKVVATASFHDAYCDDVLRSVGDEFEVDDARAEYLAGLGLVKRFAADGFVGCIGERVDASDKEACEQEECEQEECEQGADV